MFKQQQIVAATVFLAALVSSPHAQVPRRAPVRGPGPAAAAQTAIPAHDLGALLASTDAYDVYERQSSQGLCRGGFATVVLVFKGDDTYVIQINDDYRARFEREVMPLLRARCNPLQQINVYNHVRGFILSFDGVYTYDSAASVSREEALVSFSIMVDAQGRLDLPAGVKDQRYSVAAFRDRVNSARAAKQAQETERQRELQAATAAGQYPIRVHSQEYFVNSPDKDAVCGPTVDVTMRAVDKRLWAREQLTPTVLRQHAARIQMYYCDRSFERTKVNFTMLAGEQVVRRVSVDSDGILAETFVDPAHLRNPSGESLNTAGLFHGPWLDHLFYGRFDMLRQEDPGRGHFSWLYTEFVAAYSRRYRQHLMDPVTIEITTMDDGRRESSRFTMDRRLAESWRKERANVTGLVGIGRYRADINAILTRHAPPSKALAQLYENFYRYASNLPPIQDQP